MNEFPILLADFDIGNVVQIIFIVLVIIGALAGQLKGAAGPRQPPRRPVVPPGGRENQGDRPPADQTTLQRELGREIDKFLGRETPPSRRNVVVSDWNDDDVDESEPDVVDAQVVADADVASHVERHLGSSRFNERVPHLAEGIEGSDEKLESRLQQKFDHRLGKLRDTTTPGPEFAVAEGTDAGIWGPEDGGPTVERAAADVTAQTIADTLRHPERIRQAVILSEILDRPTQRWE